MKNIDYIRSHWISLDICPVCKSTKTFHSEWMNDREIQKKAASNVFGLEFRRSIETIDPSREEAVIHKRDLCLECGHTWIMYVSHICYDKTPKDED